MIVVKKAGFINIPPSRYERGVFGIETVMFVIFCNINSWLYIRITHHFIMKNGKESVRRNMNDWQYFIRLNT